MKIIKIAVGNAKEAYIEDKLNQRFNIISSDDNNKGKTIIIQSLMYALGNEPTFPTSFEYKDYYYYVEFKVADKQYNLCRYREHFVLKHASILTFFENVLELKRYWNKNIFRLPSIIKNGTVKIVDPVLFMQLFFVGQDKKDTSNIAHHGFYNKQDFYEMLYAYMGIGSSRITQDEVDQLKCRIINLADEKKLLLKQHKILKSKKTPVTYLSVISDQLAFREKISSLQKNQDQITDLRKTRNRVSTRKSKWETTKKELSSLNTAMASGELRCMDCNSPNISFGVGKSNKLSYSFDISTTEMRKEIIESINEKISSYSEEIEKLSIEIGVKQKELQELMDDDEVSLESIVAYKNDVFSASDAGCRIAEIEKEISLLETQLEASTNASSSAHEKKESLLATIKAEMAGFYQKIDPEGNTVYDSLFTRKNEVYSGSEATVFHLVKLLALRIVTKHHFPIIIDSFRAEDLSTVKENVVIQMVKKIENQVIFTTTLKKEEDRKYDVIEGVNNIDYGSHAPSKILSERLTQNFKILLLGLAIKI